MLDIHYGQVGIVGGRDGPGKGQQRGLPEGAAKHEGGRSQ